MDFVGGIKFVVKCIDVLAWPLFGVVYPICASIRAIETDSSSDSKKLVAYWVFFSLLFLFEHAFVKLLEWLPFWLYIKLIISCCLVIPNFDGAFYVYKHFLRPCLSMDTQLLIDRFKERKRKELSFKRNDFEAEVKKYVKESGPEAREELVAGKVKKQSTNFVEKDVKTVEITEEKDVGAAKQVNQTEPHLVQTEDNNFVPKKVKEISETLASVEEELSEKTVSKKFQEWTCPMCQASIQCESSLNSHLNGRRHKAALESLMAKNKPSKSKVPAASEDKKSGLPVPGAEKSGSRSSSAKKLIKSNCVEQRQGLWWCTICNRSCNSIHDMNCHLKGRNHLAEIKLQNEKYKI